MFSRILVPLDGSELSERALLPALQIAKKPNAAVTFLRVPIAQQVLISTLEGIDPYVEAWAKENHLLERDEAAEYLASLKKSYESEDLVLRIELAEGDVVETILDYARDHGLIVMSTHGYSGITKWVMGSVTEKVLAAAPCPVLIVRSAQPIHRILLPLDGSPLSESALAPGLELAARLNASAILFRVADEITGLERAQLGLGSTDLANRLQDGLVREAEEYLNSLVVPPPDALRMHQAIVIGTSAAARILDYGPHHNIDLIVMATHGRTGLSKWVYGSVTEKVLHNSRCSMLVIRPPKHRLN